MKNKKLIYQIYYYSEIIVTNVFWIYFIAMMIYRFFIRKTIPLILSYLFFLLIGLFLGYRLCRKAYDYLKAHKEDS